MAGPAAVHWNTIQTSLPRQEIIFFLVELIIGYEVYETKNAIKSISTGASVDNFNYTFDGDGKIIAVAITGNTNTTYTYQYQCN